jgi:hypothetical protein
MSTTKEKLQVAVLVLAFPVLMGAAYAIYRYNQRYKTQRKRLAELDQAGCETGESWDR